MKKLLAVVIAVASATAFAVTDYVWTGNGDDNRWSTAGNWETSYGLSKGVFSFL